MFDGISFLINDNDKIGLTGRNGAGKSTLLKVLKGIQQIDGGDIMYPKGTVIGYLPQEASVFRKLSVEDNIAAVLEMTSMSREEQRNKLETLLNEFRLQHVRKSNGDVLSGGERRRTEIARALSVDPKFILLDEPFAGIGPIAVEDIQAIVARLKYQNIGILITDHNVTETLSICDRAYLLIDGKIYKHGTAEELAGDDEVKRLYLGRNFELRRKDYLHDEARDHNSDKNPPFCRRKALGGIPRVGNHISGLLFFEKPVEGLLLGRRCKSGQLRDLTRVPPGSTLAAHPDQVVRLQSHFHQLIQAMRPGFLIVAKQQVTRHDRLFFGNSGNNEKTVPSSVKNLL